MVQILDLETLSWRESSQELPMALRYGTVVPYGDDTFLIVGGDDNVNYSDQILMFNPDNESWTDLEQRMEFGKRSAYAALVHDSKVNCS